MTSKHDSTIQKALFALNEFVQNLDYDLKLYLEDVMRLLLQYIQAPQFSRDVKYWALTSLSSTIMVAEKKIIPYASDLMQALTALTLQQGSVSEQQNVKGQALKCVGSLAASCGKEHWQPETTQVFTGFALECLKSDNKYELKENAISYFSDLSVLMREDVPPCLEQVLEEILKVCHSEEEFTPQEGEKKKDFSLDSDSDDEELGIEVDVSQIDEKSAAINALGIISLNSPKLCQPKMKEILEALEHLQGHFHENVKFHVSLAYLQIAVGLMRRGGVMNEEDKFDWVKGDIQASALPEEVTQYVNQVLFPYFYKVFDEEDNKEVIERVLENMREMAEDLGPAVFNE